MNTTNKIITTEAALSESNRFDFLIKYDINGACDKINL